MKYVLLSLVMFSLNLFAADRGFDSFAFVRDVSGSQYAQSAQLFLDVAVPTHAKLNLFLLPAGKFALEYTELQKSSGKRVQGERHSTIIEGTYTERDEHLVLDVLGKIVAVGEHARAMSGEPALRLAMRANFRELNPTLQAERLAGSVELTQAHSKRKIEKDVAGGLKATAKSLEGKPWQRFLD